MDGTRTRWMAGLAAITAVTTTTAPTLAQPGGGDSDPVTLRMAVADDYDRRSSPYVRAFIADVAERTDGAVTIEPEWNAGATTPEYFEQGVAHLLVDGEADLALSAARGWYDVGITSLLALQAPFLITNDALAVAVATSPIADDMLSGMEDRGVTGLALWVEDLRHLTAFAGCAEPIVAPQQLEGLTVRAIPSALTLDLLAALGATHFYDDAAVTDDCAIQAAEVGLGPSGPTQVVTGDVTFVSQVPGPGCEQRGLRRARSSPSAGHP